MTETIRVSHSTIRSLHRCPRTILFEQVLRLYPLNGSTALRYGSAYHKAMEAYYSNGKDINKAIEAAAAYWQKPTVQIFVEDYRTLENLLSSLLTYHQMFGRDKEEVVGVPEKKMIAKILLTDEEKSHYGDISVDFVVVIDLVTSLEGMIWIKDFKTTSVDLPYMASRLRRMPQLMGYQFVAQEHINEVSGTMVSYHQLKATKSRKTGLYGELKTDFMNFPMIYVSSEYDNWRTYVIYNASKFHIAAKAGFPPNYLSCYEFNKSCPYLPLCESPKWDIDRFMSVDGFVVVPDEREEQEAATDE